MAKTARTKVKVVPAGGSPSRIRVYRWQSASPGDVAPKKNDVFVGSYDKARFKHTYHVLTGELSGDAGDDAHAPHGVDYEAALAVYDMKSGAAPEEPWPQVNAALTPVRARRTTAAAQKAAPKKAAPKKAAPKKK